MPAKKVLVIDDMQAELQLMSQYLQSAGYVVITAQSGNEALTIVQSNCPDVIVTDLVMPELTGLELCRLLKKEAGTAKIPIVACSTKDRQVDQVWAKKQGIAAYVVKPCSQAQLVSAVQSVMV
jgi:two-component system, chemotaxis family, response regulator PixH